MASWVSLSPSRLDSLFHETLGMGPVAYVTELRIQRACTELILTGKTVKEIAYAVGYENPFYFTRSFKQHTGFNPTSYRKAVRESHDSVLFATRAPLPLEGGRHSEGE
jgi:AraC-like DNA-binding protein